jgi:hypothetical protein
LKRQNSILFSNSRIIQIYSNKIIHDRTFVNVRETGPDDFGLSVRVWFAFKRKSIVPGYPGKGSKKRGWFLQSGFARVWRVRGFG